MSPGGRGKNLKAYQKIDPRTLNNSAFLIMSTSSYVEMPSGGVETLTVGRRGAPLYLQDLWCSGYHPGFPYPGRGLDSPWIQSANAVPSGGASLLRKWSRRRSDAQMIQGFTRVQPKQLRELQGELLLAPGRLTLPLPMAWWLRSKLPPRWSRWQTAPATPRM